MTIEQKAKAYDEALERARSLQHDNGWVTTIFPELKESEDEKMRKAALKGIEFLEMELGWDAIGDTNILDVKEYLEKQKGQNCRDEECTDFTIYHPLKNGKGKYECIPYSFYGSLTSFSEDKDLISFLRTCFYTEEECNKWIAQQKEQKPIFRVGDYVRNIKTGDEVLIEQLDTATKTYCYVGHDSVAEIHSDFPFSKQDEWEVIGHIEQKPAESEDERIRKELLEEIEFIIPHEDETDSEGLMLPSYHTRISKYRSYLEKQKEPENVSATTMIPSCWTEKQKEQKPADERMRKAALKGIEFLEMELGWDAIGDTDILDVKEYLEKQKEQEQSEVDLEKFTEKIKTFQRRYKHPEIVPIKGAMAFMARMFYQYPNVARQWYESLSKAIMEDERKEE